MFDTYRLKHLFFILSIILVLIFPNQYCRDVSNSQLHRYSNVIKANALNNPFHLDNEKCPCIYNYLHKIFFAYS